MHILTLNDEPLVELWTDFISQSELDKFNFNDLTFNPSTAFVFDDRSKNYSSDRTSSTNFDTHNITPFIRERIKNILVERNELPLLELDDIEPMQITEYKPDQFYVPHYDYFNVPGYENTLINDRVATVIVYLNDDFMGGHTKFPKLNVDVKPNRGMALYFKYNYNKELNATTIHSGERVLMGKKYITQAFIRGNTWNTDIPHRT